MWSTQLRLVVLLVILPAAVPVFCAHCGHKAAPHARFCGGCGEMLNQVNILPTFVAGGIFLTSTTQVEEFHAKHDKETGKFADAGLCPSAKKKQATVDQHRPHNVQSAIVLLRMPLVWEIT